MKARIKKTIIIRLYYIMKFNLFFYMNGDRIIIKNRILKIILYDPKIKITPVKLKIIHAMHRQLHKKLSK